MFRHYFFGAKHPNNITYELDKIVQDERGGGARRRLSPIVVRLTVTSHSFIKCMAMSKNW